MFYGLWFMVYGLWCGELRAEGLWFEEWGAEGLERLKVYGSES